MSARHCRIRDYEPAIGGGLKNALYSVLKNIPVFLFRFAPSFVGTFALGDVAG